MTRFRKIILNEVGKVSLGQSRFGSELNWEGERLKQVSFARRSEYLRVQ